MTLRHMILAAGLLAMVTSGGAIAQDDDDDDVVAEDSSDPMEDAFGSDLSGVRVHSGGSATTATEEVGATAYTHGNQVTFSRGDRVENGPGQRLLNHELTHTVQQQQSVASPDAASDGSEAEENDDADSRIPSRLRHRDRATSDEDTEDEPRRVRRPHTD